MWSWQLINKWSMHSLGHLEEDAEKVRGIVSSDHFGQCCSSVGSTKRVLKRCPFACIGPACCMWRPGEWEGGGLKSTTILLTFTIGICISKQGHVSELFNGHVSQNENKRAAKLPWCHGLPSQHLYQIHHPNEASNWGESLIWSEKPCTHSALTLIRMPLVRSRSPPIHGLPTQQRLATFAWPATGSRSRMVSGHFGHQSLASRQSPVTTLVTTWDTTSCQFASM